MAAKECSYAIAIAAAWLSSSTERVGLGGPEGYDAQIVSTRLGTMTCVEYLRHIRFASLFNGILAEYKISNARWPKKAQACLAAVYGAVPVFEKPTLGRGSG